MAAILKWSYRLTLVFVVIGVLGTAVVLHILRQSLPDYEGTLAVDKLTAPVDILRDHAAVPHIFAQSDADALFALGYSHAQDRLWQMTLARRAIQGRLSEIFGKDTLKTDILMRRFGLYAAAQQSAASLDQETKDLLLAYAAGVNTRLQEVNDKALGRGAPEFFLFPADIAPWQPADSIAMIKLMALQLTSAMNNEILRAQVDLALQNTPEMSKDVLPDVPNQPTVAIKPYSAVMNAPANIFPDGHVKSNEYAFGLAPTSAEFSGASNAFAAAPDRTAGRAALLANDPHLGLSAPSIWYLARLSTPTSDIIGATIPGIPAILLGRNEHIAWGLTTANNDDQDIVMEALNPKDTSQYRTPNGYAPFVTQRSIINIKDEAPLTLALRWSRNGPILASDMFDLGKITPAGHVPALKWTALWGEDHSIKAAIGIMRAKSVDEALRESANFIAPSQNLTVAQHDKIAMKIIGARPKRQAGHETKGRLPTLGWREVNDWQGFFDDASAPSFVAPSEGLLANSNNKTVDAPFPMHLSFDWGDSQRVLRMRKLLGGREIHSRESFIEAQLDTVSTPARNLLPLVGAELWYAPNAAQAGSADALREEAIKLLANWNGEMDEHRPEPLIYAAWMRELQRVLIEDELGTLAEKFTHIKPLFLERVYRDIDGASVWCDVKHSSTIETCPQMAQIALDKALVWITQTYGDNLESLQWGQAHEARHDHSVLGQVPFLNYLVNIRHFSGGGDFTLMRGKTKGTDDAPFASVHAAAYRGVYDFSDPDGSVFITSTGQSGHFLSSHYDDLSELWHLGEYLPMSLNKDIARGANQGLFRLTPISDDN